MDNIKVRTVEKPNPWLGLLSITILPALIPLNIILWKWAIG